MFFFEPCKTSYKYSNSPREMTLDKQDSVDYSVILIAYTVCGVTCIILIFMGCMWCRDGWKKITQRPYRFSNSVHETSLSPVENITEFTIFPPPSRSNLPSEISADEVVFEPLPEIRSRGLKLVSGNVRPACFTSSFSKISLQDWFDEQQINFPRNQLNYLREVGSTWYGQAVEGEAYSIVAYQSKTKVVVKILRVDATATEHMQYLQETRPFRDLKHPNLLMLFGRCLEVHPFLLVMEHCIMDLKTYLTEQRKLPEMLLKNGLILRMACNISAALQYMHEHGFVHTGIAAHNCLVTSDFIVKVGDYGTAVHLHKDDFYFLGDVAFPIRWCAPESLLCTETMIEAKCITKEANIWSFGVLLWEILEFGKLPYIGLTNDEVVQKVLIECCLKLEQPKTPCVHKDMIYKIMQLCWLPATERPTMQKVTTLLNYLYDNQDVLTESSAFESRWNALQPVVREHNLHNPPQNISLQFESDFISKKEQDSLRDCDSMMSSEFDQNQYEEKSPSSGSFSIELTSDISPSLLNLRGSVEDLITSVDVVQNGNQNSACTSEHESLETLPADNDIESDAIELRITEAINDLDTILAEEPSSSDTSKCNTPEKIQNQKLKSDCCDYTKVNGNEQESHYLESTKNISKSWSDNDCTVYVSLSDSE